MNNQDLLSRGRIHGDLRGNHSGAHRGGPVAIAIDVGGTKVESAAVLADGSIVANSRFRKPTGREKSAEELASQVTDVVSQTKNSLPPETLISGVGIGSAGPVDTVHGAVSPLNLPAWRGFPIRDHVQRLFPETYIALAMDGQCITLAEHWIGAGVNVSNLMGMIVSTGVGGGLVLGGLAISGATGNAGHVGHIEVGGFDVECPCGGRGCLEAIASGPSSVSWARQKGWQGRTGEELASAYTASDAIAVAAIRRAGTAIGRAIGSASALVDLDVVAISGGFSRVTPDLFGYINEGLASRMGFSYVAKTLVIPSLLNDEGPLIGAAALIHRRSAIESALH